MSQAKDLFSQTLFSDVLALDDRTPFTEAFDWEAQGMSHPVLVAGEGPGILLMHELPGFVPEFWRLAHWLVAAGLCARAL